MTRKNKKEIADVLKQIGMAEFWEQPYADIEHSVGCGSIIWERNEDGTWKKSQNSFYIGSSD